MTLSCASEAAHRTPRDSAQPGRKSTSRYCDEFIFGEILLRFIGTKSYFIGTILAFIGMFSRFIGTISAFIN